MEPLMIVTMFVLLAVGAYLIGYWEGRHQSTDNLDNKV